MLLSLAFTVTKVSELSFDPLGEARPTNSWDTVDDINPALPIQRNIP